MNLSIDGNNIVGKINPKRYAYVKAQIPQYLGIASYFTRKHGCSSCIDQIPSATRDYATDEGSPQLSLSPWRTQSGENRDRHCEEKGPRCRHDITRLARAKMRVCYIMILIVACLVSSHWNWYL